MPDGDGWGAFDNAIDPIIYWTNGVNPANASNPSGVDNNGDGVVDIRDTGTGLYAYATPVTDYNSNGVIDTPESGFSESAAVVREGQSSVLAVGVNTPHTRPLTLRIRFAEVPAGLQAVALSGIDSIAWAGNDLHVTLSATVNQAEPNTRGYLQLLAAEDANTTNEFLAYTVEAGYLQGGTFTAYASSLFTPAPGQLTVLDNDTPVAPSDLPDAPVWDAAAGVMRNGTAQNNNDGISGVTAGIQGTAYFLFLVFCVVILLFPLQHATAAEPLTIVDEQIKILMSKTYYVSTQNSKVSIKKIPLGSEEEWAKKLESGGYGQPCQENLAKLNRPGAAAKILGTSHILAFLDCPATNDGVSEYIIALFDRSNIDVPVCFGIVNQGNTDIKFSGYLTAIDVRKSLGHGYYGVLVWNSGDAGSWTKGLALVHITDKCAVTAVQQFLSGGGPAEFPGCREGYKGTDIEYRFVDAMHVEIVESKLMICDAKRTKVTVGVTKVSLEHVTKSRSPR